VESAKEGQTANSVLKFRTDTGRKKKKGRKCQQASAFWHACCGINGSSPSRKNHAADF
jgi:hypothetical protein